MTRKIVRIEYVHDKEHNVLVCEACGAVVVALVKHAEFHKRIDRAFWDSDAMLGLETQGPRPAPTVSKIN